MKKEPWYTLTESRLYEMKTFDTAILHLQRRGDAAMLQVKLEAKQDIEHIISLMDPEDQNFIRIVYASNTQASPTQLQALLHMTSATYFRRKKDILRRVAQFLGHV